MPETVSQPGNNAASQSMDPMAQTPSANTSGAGPGSAGQPQTGSMPEMPLAPIQLTPQRMQSIGIVLGKVESKSVNSELRFYGNVQVNERRQAYVQTRFSGWIRHVYADATGNFIGKGQPLFTIYSPDLVTTEQEYLLAKKTNKPCKVAQCRACLVAPTRCLRRRVNAWTSGKCPKAKLRSSIRLPR